MNQIAALTSLNPGGPGFDAIVQTATAAAAIGLAWWLVSLAIWVTSDRFNLNVRWVGALTMPGSRRAAGAMLSLSILAGACGTSPTPPGLEVMDTAVTESDDADPTPTTLATTTTTTERVTTTAAPTTSTTTDALEVGTEDADQTADTAESPDHDLSVHTVTAGESLWSIAQARLEAADEAPTPSEVATYWAELVRTARDQLASGSPDLIFPGEELELPPLPA